ncbi:PAS domain S-box protein [Chloroflexota bacterium]
MRQTNLKRLLEKALDSTHSTARTKTPKTSLEYPHDSEMQTVVESISEAIYKVDVYTKQITFVSPQVKGILGYTPLELMDIMNGYLRIPFYHEDDAQKVATGRYNFLVRCLNEGVQESYEAEYRVKHKNGGVLWVSESIYPHYSADGIIESFVGKIADITGRKQIEEVLRESEERFRNLYEESPIGIELYDSNGQLVDVNRACLEIFGVSNVTEVRSFKLFEDPNLPDGVKNRLHKRETVKCEIPFNFEKVKEQKLYETTKSGIIHISVLITPLGLREKQPLSGYLVQIQDVTEHKRVEKELKESEEKYRTLFESKLHGVVVIDKKMNLLLANQAAANIAGYNSVKELLEANVFELLPPEERARVLKILTEDMFENNLQKINEFRLLNKSGEEIWISALGTSTGYEGKTVGLASFTDITDRKRVEQALQASEEKYRDLVENLNDVIYTVDKEGQITYISPVIKSFSGYSPSEMIGHPLSDFIYPEDLSQAISGFRRTASGVIETREYRFLTKSGEIRWTRSSSQPIFAENRVVGLQGVLRDITERKQMEEALQQSEDFSSSLLSNSANPILVLNPDNSIKYVNSAVEKLTGFSSDELIGRKAPYPWWTEENLHETSSDFEVAMRRGVKKLEELFQKKNGERFWVEITSNPVRHDNELKYYVSNWVDITERKQMEEALRHSEEKLRRMFESVTDAITITDLNGLITECNERTVSMHRFGFKHEVLGRSAFALIADSDHERAKENLQKTIENRVVTNIEYTLIRADGTEFPGELSASILKDTSGKPVGFVAITRDITERKQMEEALRESEQNFRNSLDNSPLGIGIVNVERELLYANQAILNIYGYSSIEELKTTPPKQRYTPQSYVEWEERQEGRRLGKPVPLSFEVSIVRKDGEVRNLAVLRKEVIWGGETQFQALYRDITEQKRAEKALRESEKRYRELADLLPQIVFEIDERGSFSLANRQAFLSSGYTSEDFEKGLNAFQMFVPEDRDRVRENIQRVLNGENLHGIEYTALRKDGSTFPVIAYSAPVTRGGKRVGLRGIIVDIAERKQMEESLRESEQNFRNSLDNSPLGITIINAEGELLYANQAILDIYGYSSIEELKATPTKQRYTPQSYAEFKERKERRRLGNPVPPNYEISIVRKDGEVRNLAVLRKEVIWSGETQYQTLNRDITEQKRAEKALRESEEFNVGLLNNSPHPILVLNIDTSIRYVNPAVEKLTGFSSDELIGRKAPYPWWIKEDYKQYTKTLAKAMHHGLARQEGLFRKKDGEYFWIEINSMLVGGERKPKYSISNWVDITERKRLRENMEFYISEVARAQEEERKRIAREIHDDSVQSLATLSLNIDALARENLPEHIVQRIEGLRAETSSILDGLRRLSHDLRPGVIDQIGLVPAVEMLVEELNNSSQINVSLRVMGSERRLGPEIELALFRVTQEALRNVTRHSGATKVEMRLNFTRGKVRLTVRDNGRGFKIPKILGDFAIESKLGLIGVQERVRLLNGRLWVKSRPGRGTTVVAEVKI